MPYYALNMASANAIVTSLRDALQSAGILESVQHLSGGTIVFKTTRFQQLIRVTVSGDTDKRPLVYYGTAHTGGGNLANQVRLVEYGVGTTMQQWWLVVNAGCFAISAKATATNFAHVLFFRTLDGGYPIMGAVTESAGHGAGIYEADSNTAVQIAGLYSGSWDFATSDGANRLMYPLLVFRGVNLLSNGGTGVAAITRAGGFVGGLELYGDSVVLCGGRTQFPAQNFVPTLIMPGAA